MTVGAYRQAHSRSRVGQRRRMRPFAAVFRRPAGPGRRSVGAGRVPGPGLPVGADPGAVVIAGASAEGLIHLGATRLAAIRSMGLNWSIWSRPGVLPQADRIIHHHGKMPRHAVGGAGRDYSRAGPFRVSALAPYPPARAGLTDLVIDADLSGDEDVAAPPPQ